MTQGERKVLPSVALGLAVACVFTVAGLLLLAFLTCKMGLGEQSVRWGIGILHLVCPAAGGWVMGRKMGWRKYLWGLIFGGVYFGLLAVISLLFGEEAATGESPLLLTGLLCLGGGMLGGMLG